MQKELLSNLLISLRSIDQVYHSAIYGASHKEARIVKLFAKLGSEYAQKRLTHKELIKAIKEIEAIDKSEKEKLISIDLNSKDLSLLRKVMKDELRTIKKIPTLSREQAIISLTTIFEGYISDMVRNIFDNNIDALKSTKSSLKDEELIESIKKGNTLEKLKEVKIRNLMYGSVDSWIKYFQIDLGFDIEIPNNIIELFLVRNCLIHNNRLVSRDIEKKMRKRRYVYGKQINITERDYNRYKIAVANFAKKVWGEYITKFQTDV